MRTFFKYLFPSFLILFLALYYLLFTCSGNAYINRYLSKYLSAKSQNEVTVYDFDFNDYPYIEVAMKINKSSDLVLDGLVTSTNLEVHYHLWGDDVKFNHNVLPDAIDVRGEIKGALSDIFINGKGMLLGGEGIYEFRKMETGYRDIKVELQSINSKNLFKLLKRRTVMNGDANISVDMPIFDVEQRKGSIDYFLENGNVEINKATFPLTLHSKIVLDNLKFNYTMDMNSTMGKINFTEGKFDQKNQAIGAMYTLDIYDLAFFENILKHKYRGGLHAKGELLYQEAFHIKGETSKFNGKIYFDYDEKEMVLKLEALSLEDVLNEFNSPTLLTSDIFGTITYDLKHKMVVFDNRLKKVQLKRNSMTDMLFNVTKIDMTKHLYDKSTFIGFYQDNILGGVLKLDSGQEHIVLDKLHFNSKTKAIRSNVDLKIEGQRFFVSLYGTTRNPKFNIDMRRILEYQLEKNSKKMKSLFNSF